MSRGARKPVARDSEYVPEIELYMHNYCSQGLAHYSHVLSEGGGVVVLNHEVLGSNPTGTWLSPGARHI